MESEEEGSEEPTPPTPLIHDYSVPWMRRTIFDFNFNLIHLSRDHGEEPGNALDHIQ